MHGSTGRGWKRSPRPPRQSLTLREAFQATDEELGFTKSQELLSLGRPLAIPVAHLRSSGPVVISSLRMVLETNVQADARIGPPYLIPAVQGQLPVMEEICRITRGSDHEDALRLGSQFTEFSAFSSAERVFA